MNAKRYSLSPSLLSTPYVHLERQQSKCRIIRLLLPIVSALSLFVSASAAAQKSSTASCDGSGNQLESSYCAASSEEDVDKRLNEIYKELIGKLSKDGANRLQKAERAWISFRDAECGFVNGPAPENFRSYWNEQNSSCKKKLAERRISELEAYTACQGSNCPD